MDVLKAVHAVQGIMSEVLKAAKGEHKPKDGVSMKDEMHEFQESIRTLVKRCWDTAARDRRRVGGDAVRVVGDGAAVQ